MDLYNGMQPYLDKIKAELQELQDLKEKDRIADAELNRISIAVVGVPNAVSLLLSGLLSATS